MYCSTVQLTYAGRFYHLAMLVFAAHPHRWHSLRCSTFHTTGLLPAVTHSIMQPYWQHEHSHNLVIMSLYRTPFHRYTRIGSTAGFTTATGSFNQPIYPWYQANLHSSEAVITSAGAHTADATGFNRCFSNVSTYAGSHTGTPSWDPQLYHSTIYSHSSDFTSSTMAIGGSLPLYSNRLNPGTLKSYHLHKHTLVSVTWVRSQPSNRKILTGSRNYSQTLDFLTSFLLCTLLY